jgi:hypothetical protein
MPLTVVDESHLPLERNSDDFPLVDPSSEESLEFPPPEVEDFTPLLQTSESYHCLGHRAVLDLGSELFECLEELNGLKGEYVLHIYEQTGTR